MHIYFIDKILIIALSHSLKKYILTYCISNVLLLRRTHPSSSAIFVPRDCVSRIRHATQADKPERTGEPLHTVHGTFAERSERKIEYARSFDFLCLPVSALRNSNNIFPPSGVDDPFVLKLWLVEVSCCKTSNSNSCYWLNVLPTSDYVCMET